MERDDLVVLAVDDDKINLMLLRSLLAKSEIVIEVIEVMNGQEAIRQLKGRDDIDVMLLDIIMPIMGGLETIQVVRADANIKQVPIIVLTTDETKREEALELGANDFLMKPINKTDLITKMQSVVI
ncbi:MAG: response regulator [Campylobacterota bacterium]|nr:response regulator [Campylobacterota bacterium]